MRPNMISRGLFAFLLIAAIAAGQERKPANILPADRAGILLMEGREQLERPDLTLDYMGLKDGDTVADLGCGNGFYTLRLAGRLAPSGVVYATDIQQGMLDQMTTRATEAGAKNIKPVLGTATDPMLPAGKINWVLMVDVYHEFSDPKAMLAKVRECLAPEGRVALLEFRAEQDPAVFPFPIPREHKMTVEEVMNEWTAAGFALVERKEFLPAQHLFVFKAGSGNVWDASVPIESLGVGAAPKLSTFGEHVYFAGQPVSDDLKLLADRGVRTILNLRSPEEMQKVDFDEAARAKELGMEYINVPVGAAPPNEEALEQIFKVLNGASQKPVLMHCASSNRVGAMWALFRGKHQGRPADAAIAEGKAAGLSNPALETTVRELLK
ncbi:MAG: methyltransferase domain-containing protein [Candidatus Hydrogenedentota bacterium]